MSLNLGQTLKNGKYTIERELGRGRFGITYLTKDTDGKPWVIKILNSDVLAILSAEERKRLEQMFWQEGAKLARCHGTPHIVQAEMPFREGDLICLPMEYVDGVSLADRADRILVEKNALAYIRQIGDALTVVHGRNLVHCDIRPANILLRIRGDQAEAMLIDFGLALTCDTVLSRTRENERSDGFSPIELYLNPKKVGPYTDVYALAATLYELLTGTVPTNPLDRQLHHRELVKPQERNHDISGQTARAILTGMTLDADKRPQSILDWLKLLPVPEKVPEISLKRPIDWGKWGTIWAAIGVFVAVLFGVLGWLPKPSPPSTTTPSPQAKPQTLPKVQVPHQ